MAITTAIELASYIKGKYEAKYHIEISPLKLQKSLYFCFAYWGGFVRKGKNNSNMSEVNMDDLNEVLFDDEIQAWLYGPVVPIVYKNQDTLIGTTQSPFTESFVCQYIDGILDDILRVSDFSLVEESHKDNSWKDSFDFAEYTHNNTISKEKIIDEYARR